MLVVGDCQLHATTMISTAVSSYLQQPVTPQSVNPAQRADAVSSQDFAALVSRFYSPNLSVAALTQSALPPATTQAPAEDPSPRDDRVSSARDTRSTERPKRNDPVASVDAQPVSTAEPPDRATPPSGTAAQSRTDTPQPKQADAAAPTPREAQPPATDGRAAAAPPSHGADHPKADATQQALPPKDATAPQPAQTQTRPTQQDGAGTVPKAQIVDGSPKDPLPSLGSLLSGRTAVAAQSEAGKASPPTDNATGPKSNSPQQVAASALTSAAQPAAGADAKAKVQTRLGGASNANHNGQSANGTQAGQAAGAAAGQPAQQTAPATPQQSGFGNALSANSGGASGGADETDAQTSLPGRSEQITLAGAGQPGQQSAPRAAEAAAPAKPAAPLPPRLVANQVAVQIQKAVGDGNDRISIQLKPADLGKVDVRLDVGSDGRVSAVITAHRADTLDLLQRDARILQNALQDAGLHADANSLSFELKSNGGGNGNDGSNSAGSGSRGGAAIEDVTAVSPTATQARPGIVTNDRVDIHV